MKKVIVITGTTSGVGEDLSYKFINMNYTVIGIARNKQKLLELENKLGQNFKGIIADVTNEKDVNKAFQIIKQLYKKIDVLINNAAIFKRGEFVNQTYEDINSIIDTNVKGVMYCTLEAIKLMKNNDDLCKIINIASVSGLHGIPEQVIYSASKHAIRGFSESLGQELIKYNIFITTICPGGIDTPLWNINNPYPGENKSDILNVNDITNLVKYVIELPNNVILKEVTLFPKNEWH